MTRTRGRTGGTAPIWIVSLGLAAGTGLVLLATRGLESNAPAAIAASSGVAAERLPDEVERVRVERDAARLVATSRARVWVDAGEVVEAGFASDDADPRKVSERVLRARFVARERSAPGALAALAPEVLDGDGPEGEKYALLRALDDVDAPERGRWCAHVVLDAAGKASVSLRDGALRLLTEHAARDERARGELEVLALGRRDLPVELRRRAAAGFARVAVGEELVRLERGVSGEEDEVWVAGVKSALEERRGGGLGVEGVLGR
ncbi:MAG: hypothetical protein IPJ77_21705 [Planctomycetes bacterium]|nr:hypothetical protein [Planctomycetota bacterium]